IFSTVTGGVSKNGLNIATNAQHHTSRRSTMEKDVLVVAALLLPIQIGSYCYMQKHLLNSLGIATQEPRLVSRAGTSLEDPHIGRTYERRKDCYQMDVPASYLRRFNTQVGLTINRKKTRLECYARPSRISIH